jgi:hypothetical protein
VHITHSLFNPFPLQVPCSHLKVVALHSHSPSPFIRYMCCCVLLEDLLVGGSGARSRTGGRQGINKGSCVLLLISSSEFYSRRCSFGKRRIVSFVLSIAVLREHLMVYILNIIGGWCYYYLGLSVYLKILGFVTDAHFVRCDWD